MKKVQCVLQIIAVLLLTACTKVTVVVTEIPPNTPSHASIFCSGNFNYWDSSDRSLLLNKAINRPYSHYIDLPYGWGKAIFKFTRGEWKTVEKDRCGNKIDNTPPGILKTIHCGFQ